jgi:hypothetical protein
MRNGALILCGCRSFLYVAARSGLLLCRRHSCNSLMTFEKLHGPLVLFGLFQAGECSEIAALPGFAVLFAVSTNDTRRILIFESFPYFAASVTAATIGRSPRQPRFLCSQRL